jgi:hypothetical protein
LRGGLRRHKSSTDQFNPEGVSEAKAPILFMCDSVA